MADNDEKLNSSLQVTLPKLGQDTEKLNSLGPNIDEKLLKLDQDITMDEVIVTYDFVEEEIKWKSDNAKKVTITVSLENIEIPEDSALKCNLFWYARGAFENSCSYFSDPNTIDIICKNGFKEQFDNQSFQISFKLKYKKVYKRWCCNKFRDEFLESVRLCLQSAGKNITFDPAE